MPFAPRIELRQNQSLAMTPQLQQAIKLLQMSNLELAGFVAAEAERNPLIELARPAGPSVGTSAAPRGSGTGGEGAYLDTMAAEITLHDHLHAQIGATRADARFAAAARLLADELDDDGYLRGSLPEIAARYRLSAREMAGGIALLQACEPTGIGARSLRECLALQLRDRNRLDPAMQALLDNLGLWATGRHAELQAICGVDAADFADMFAELRALDPKPGQRFARNSVEVAVPDVYVTRAAGGGWTVELNTETLPRILINNAYSAQLGCSDRATRQFISECRATANWLVRSLEQRARTILKVASEIVLYQGRFFSLGVAEMRPLTQRAVAGRLGLHESTVSRVTAGKYLACDQGNFELRFFFSSTIQATNGGEAFSAMAVQDRIRHLIHSENGLHALSDDKIVAILSQEGIDIARRTVAKYREGMGFPSSVERRRNRSAFSGI